MLIWSLCAFLSCCQTKVHFESYCLSSKSNYSYSCTVHSFIAHLHSLHLPKDVMPERCTIRYTIGYCSFTFCHFEWRNYIIVNCSNISMCFWLLHIWLSHLVSSSYFWEPNLLLSIFTSRSVAVRFSSNLQRGSGKPQRDVERIKTETKREWETRGACREKRLTET